MKIFAKRRKLTTNETTKQTKDISNNTNKKENEKENENIKSYFDKGAHDQRLNIQTNEKTNKQLIMDIPTLLQMDPNTLNSKQRRLLRREKERNDQKNQNINQEDAKKDINNNIPIHVGSNNTIISSTTTTTTTLLKDSLMSNIVEVISDDDEKEMNKDIDKSSIIIPTKDDTAIISKTDTPTTSTVSISKKDTNIPKPPSLEGLNSKDRRKALRQYERQMAMIHSSTTHSSKNQQNDNTQSNQSPTIVTSDIMQSLKEQSRQIANENKINEDSKSKKRPTSVQISKPTKPTKTTKKKDWSQLSKEEQERREKQRQMQKEAKERREYEAKTGQISKRHPLNSERRRANRRKPGKAGVLAARKKEQKRLSKEQRGNNQSAIKFYNQEGFRKRKGFA